MCLAWFHWCIIIVLLAGTGDLLQIPWGSVASMDVFVDLLKKKWIQTNIIQDSTKGFFTLLGCFFWSVTVDGWNPKQPPGMVLKPCKSWDKLPTSTGPGFQPSTEGSWNFGSWVPPINQLHPPKVCCTWEELNTEQRRWEHSWWSCCFFLGCWHQSWVVCR